MNFHKHFRLIIFFGITMEPLLDGNATRDAQAEVLGLFDENLNLKLLSI